ncbi:MAG: hypothetical protein ACR2OH_09070 [Microthrixaceae bacterium]
MRRVLVSMFVVVAVVSAACSDSEGSDDTATTVSGSEVPSGWVTHTDDASGFTLSSPGTWAVLVIDDEAVPGLLSDPDNELEEVNVANPFGAGLQMPSGWLNPSVSVTVEALPEELGVDEYVEGGRQALEELIPSYQATEQVNTVVGGREAVLVFSSYQLSELDPAEDGRAWNVELVTTDGSAGWTISCTQIVADGSAPPPDRDECNTVVRTFEIISG